MRFAPTTWRFGPFRTFQLPRPDRSKLPLELPNCKTGYIVPAKRPLFSGQQAPISEGNTNTSSGAAGPDADSVRAIKAVGDRTRLQILHILLSGEECVTDIARQLGLAQPRISHHLTILRNSGLVRDRRNGKQIFYSVNPDFRVNSNGGPTKNAIQVDCLCIEFPRS